MSNWEPSDDRPLIDAPLPSTPTPQTERAYTPTPAAGPLMDIDEAELKRILSVPPALPRQQLSSALLTPDMSQISGQSTSFSGPVTPTQGTGTPDSNKSWLYQYGSTPTTSRLPITPPMTGGSGTSTPITGTNGPNKSWLYRDAISRPTTSQLPITPPMTPPVTPLPSGPNKSWLYRESMSTPTTLTPTQSPISGPIHSFPTPTTPSISLSLGYGPSVSTSGSASEFGTKSSELISITPYPTSLIAPPITSPIAAQALPIQRHVTGHKLAPDDWQPDTHWERQSGEIDVSSDVQSVGASGGTGSRVHQWFRSLSHRNVDPNPMSNKTSRDLNKLKQRGFDVKYGQQYEIGSGIYGKVFVGTYRPEISKLTETERRYMCDIQPGTKFAAKYVQIDRPGLFMTRMYHEIEKQVMKRLIGHPNVVSFKMAINLGIKRPVVGDNNADYFYSYDRMFLIMELADQGNLAKFIQDNKKVNDVYAIQLIHQMCTGLNYIHGKGIVHGDIHWGNVLLSSGQRRGELVAKFIDFGTSLARDHWSGAHLTDQEFHNLQRIDIRQVIRIFAKLIQTAEGAGRRNTGANLEPMRQLTARLKDNDETLDTVLPDIDFETNVRQTAWY